MMKFLGLLTLSLAMLLAVLTAAPHVGEAQRVGTQGSAPPQRLALDQLPRIYGLSVATAKSPKLYLATPLGLFLAGPDGTAVPVAGAQGNVMAFAAHPGNQRHLLAGGHVGQSGSLGVLHSQDGGRRWQQISKDGAGHVGFHILAFSGAEPETVYGVTNGLSVSEDGGHRWREVGPLPEGLIHFAASAKQVKTLYAATQQGLRISHDQGVTWSPTQLGGGTASMVHVTAKGRVYVFVVGRGLMAAQEPKLDWKTVSDRFDDRILLRMAVDPAQASRLYAVTVTGAVVTSADSGRTWLAYEGSHNAIPATIGKGKQLFETYCRACHGQDGKGQQTAAGFDPKHPPPILAPALDDSAHGWHHSDESLISTILNGSPQQGSPMIAWKGQLSRADAETLVAYVKSLWSFRSIACQGARHMACMRHQ